MAPSVEDRLLDADAYDATDMMSVLEPCWCHQRGTIMIAGEDRLSSPVLNGDGLNNDEQSTPATPSSSSSSSWWWWWRRRSLIPHVFAQFSPFDPRRHRQQQRHHHRQHRWSSSSSSSARQLLTWLVVLLLLVDGVVGCGPGRRAGRRRRPRKLTPLVFKQHVPNVSENTLAASGLTEGRVSRGSKRFEDLVPNYNPDIIFKDEEGTGADRFMTPRCKEKLNTLAISVMNQWPDVKLRVTEGWDEEGYHAPNSLHYEGRAVDIATSDRDRSKYGMLARLAVEAGFDWVYYESRSHIHCSVKSESSQGKSGGCFPGTSQVTTPTGAKLLSDLAVGDSVLSMTPEGSLVYRPVLMFLDVSRDAGRTFVEITTESGRKMFLTPSHLVYVVSDSADDDDVDVVERTNEVQADASINPKFNNNKKNKATSQSADNRKRSAQAIFARDVQRGMSVLVVVGSSSTGSSSSSSSSSHRHAVESEVVVSAQPVLKTDGFFAPLTSEGTVVVDNVVASCYAVVQDQYLAHWAFWPVRTYYGVKNWLFPAAATTSTTTTSTTTQSSSTAHHQQERSSSSSASVDGRGIHWYAKMLYSLAEYVLPEKMLYDRS